tara:strand:+ start:254 stop:523 length:270 start_codon:yes stop_codon:yes gene_type:complete
MRITTKMLDYKIDQLNSILGFPKEPYTFNGSKLKTNYNTYYIAKAYGGYRVEQMCKGGGSRDITERGTKKECYLYLKGMLEGIQAIGDI